MISLCTYTARDSVQLSQAINQVCADTPWMSARSFILTDSWAHAMHKNDCHNHQLLVARAKGTLVGWCRVFPPTCSEMPAQAELGIGLLAEYRNQGIGTELIMRSLEWSAGRGLRTVDLMVSIQNSIAIHVFKKCGFETVQMHSTKMMMSICLS